MCVRDCADVCVQTCMCQFVARVFVFIRTGRGHMTTMTIVPRLTSTLPGSVRSTLHISRHLILVTILQGATAVMSTSQTENLRQREPSDLPKVLRPVGRQDPWQPASKSRREPFCLLPSPNCERRGRLSNSLSGRTVDAFHFVFLYFVKYFYT